MHDDTASMKWLLNAHHEGWMNLLGIQGQGVKSQGHMGSCTKTLWVQYELMDLHHTVLKVFMVMIKGLKDTQSYYFARHRHYHIQATLVLMLNTVCGIAQYQVFTIKMLALSINLSFVNSF